MEGARGSALLYPTETVVAESNRPTTVTFRNDGLHPPPYPDIHIQRLVIPSDLAADLLVRDIKVGGESPQPNVGDIPGVLFAPESVHRPRLGLLRVGYSVTFEVCNTGDRPRPVKAFLGCDRQDIYTGGK